MGKFDRFQAPLKAVRDVWNPPREVFLVRALITMSGGILVAFIVFTGWFFSDHSPHAQSHDAAHAEGHESSEHGEEAHGEEGAEGEHGESAEHGEEHAAAEGHGGGHGDGAEVSILARHDPIPKSIRERKTGTPLEGHDLVDPDIKEARGLAASFKSELKIEQKHRYVDLPEVAALTRQDGSFSAKVMVLTTVEVDTYEATQEVQKRMVEFQSLISALIGERRGDELKTQAGLGKLKSDIQREMNHLLRTGQVKDVLFVNLFVL